MTEFFHANLVHCLFVLLLISRLGDMVSTFLVSPNLRLEANPIARRLGWRFIVGSLVVCVIPYFSPEAAVAILAPSLLVSASNLSKAWSARAMGEEGYVAHVLNLALRTTLPQALLPLWAASAFIILAGITLVLLAAEPWNELCRWFGLGMVLYGIVQATYGALSLRAMFRRAAEVKRQSGAYAADGGTGEQSAGGEQR